MRTYEPFPSQNITAAAAKMVQLAKLHGEPIKAVFNDIHLVAYASQHPDEIITDYYDQSKLRSEGQESERQTDTLLDLAHERINALGGWYDKKDPYDRGYHDAIQQALDIIEDLGGKDPLVLRAEIAGLRERIRGWADMIKNCSGVPNNPDSLVRMLLHEMDAAIGQDRQLSGSARRGRDEAA